MRLIKNKQTGIRINELVKKYMGKSVQAVLDEYIAKNYKQIIKRIQKNEK